MPRKKLVKKTLFDAVIRDHSSLHEFDALDDILDWKKIEALLETIHASKKGGASYPPLMMFRAMLMQLWHNLSDVQAEKMLSRDLLFRRFCRLSLADPIPDHSTISRFRSALVKKGLLATLLDEVNAQLSTKGAIVKKGEVSIVDASVIESHQCRKKPGVDKDNTQDPQAGWSVKTGTKGHKEFTYGFKAHTNVDEDGFIKKVKVTAGNVHDSQVLNEILTGTEEELYADAAYAGEKIENLLKTKKIRNRINQRPYRNKPLLEDEKIFNRLMSGTRYVVERTFGALKRHYGAGKTRFMGIDRTESWITGLAIAHNIKKAMGILSPPRGQYA